MEGGDSEWVSWTAEVAAERPDIADAVKNFAAPETNSGAAATTWLQERGQSDESRTMLLIIRGELIGFYSLAMSTVELRREHREHIGVSHPQQGAVLITWLAKSRDASEWVAEALLQHATVTARRAASGEVAATALVLDPFNEQVDAYWRSRFGFRRSRTLVPGGSTLKRLWQPLFPN